MLSILLYEFPVMRLHPTCIYLLIRLSFLLQVPHIYSVTFPSYDFIKSITIKFSWIIILIFPQLHILAAYFTYVTTVFFFSPFKRDFNSDTVVSISPVPFAYNLVLSSLVNYFSVGLFLCILQLIFCLHHIYFCLIIDGFW